MKPLISIVVPTFNSACYLPEMIESVLRQTYKNWELIIMDDGSTDSTQELMESYEDPRIYYQYRPENKGISFTRNEAMAHAKGEYIAVMDADDIMNPERLELSLKAIKGVDFVYSAYLMGNEECHLIRNPGIMPPEKLTIEEVLAGGTAPHVTIMARKKCFIENPYDNNLKVNDDMKLVLSWIKAGYTYKRIKEGLMIVRLYPNSVSRTKDKEVKKITEQMREEYAE